MFDYLGTDRPPVPQSHEVFLVGRKPEEPVLLTPHAVVALVVAPVEIAVVGRGPPDALDGWSLARVSAGVDEVVEQAERPRECLEAIGVAAHELTDGIATVTWVEVMSPPVVARGAERRPL